MSEPRHTARDLIAGRRAAERRAGWRTARPHDPSLALQEALELWELNPQLFDAPPDPVRVREVERVRAMWRKLSANHRGHP